MVAKQAARETARPLGPGARSSTYLEVPVYGCEVDEAAVFRETAPGLGITPIITAAPVVEATVQMATGSRCISVGHKTRITNQVLLALSEVGVRYISTRSVGCNHLDVDYARQVGITVENVAYSPDSVADYTLMLMLMAVRHAASTIRRVEGHDYRLNDVRGRELRDLTVGVVGTGRIGSAVIERLRGFGCRVLAFDRQRRSPVQYVPLDDLLQHSDIVTLHAPLDATTHHLLDRARFARLKPGAYLINTARGGLVHTEALIAALESGRLAGAALDVVEEEHGVFYADRRDRPVEDAAMLRLHALPNVIITPHTAYFTDHALTDAVVNSLINCVRFEEGFRRA